MAFSCRLLRTRTVHCWLFYFGNARPAVISVTLAALARLFARVNALVCPATRVDRGGWNSLAAFSATKDVVESRRLAVMLRVPNIDVRDLLHFSLVAHARRDPILNPLARVQLPSLLLDSDVCKSTELFIARQ